MRKILITNDDGIKSDGLVRLARAAKTFGEVWVVAPESQRSAASHSINLHTPIDVYPFDFPVEGVHGFSCSGTPGDCIRVGIHSVMPEMPDLVFAGINYGYNIASDIQYSATVGAAFEAEFQGIPAIAFSENSGTCHEVTDEYLEMVIKETIGMKVGPGQIVNVNFPGCTLANYKGILRDRKVSRELVFEDRYPEVEKLPGGGVRYMVKGKYHEILDENSDARAVHKGYISIGLVNNVG